MGACASNSSMDKIAFTKMEGCGNDYVYVDGINTAFPIARAPDLARRWSDRHFGIGADGLIVLARDPDGALRMLMWNADGSRGAMCGNGLGCLARFAEVSGHTTGQAFVVMTDSGRRQVELLGAGNGSGDVRTHMGMVTCQLARPIEVAGGSYDFICGDAGNPHAVTFVADVELAAVDKIGAALQHHAAIGQRAGPVEVGDGRGPDSQNLARRKAGRGEVILRARHLIVGPCGVGNRNGGIGHGASP